MTQAALRLDHVTIMASDLAASARFYDALWMQIGLTKRRDHVWEDGAGFFVELRAARPGTRPYERHGAGINHIGFRAGSPAQVAALRARMLASGFDMPEIQMLGAATALFAKDPDGFRVEVTHYPEGTSVID